tara:strand:- start:1257 stop:1556 length:300 start_codon:yes stop_codon:yes gene_type:complete
VIVVDKQERYEMIKAAAIKLEFRNKMQSKSGSRKVPLHLRLRKAGKYTDEGEKIVKEEVTIAQIADDVNINHWTDSSSYAKDHYGERAAAVNKDDNDWN